MEFKPGVNRKAFRRITVVAPQLFEQKPCQKLADHWKVPCERGDGWGKNPGQVSITNTDDVSVLRDFFTHVPQTLQLSSRFFTNSAYRYGAVDPMNRG